MDETVINGANLFFADQFGIDPSASSRNQWLLGLVNSAPYVCIARLRQECLTNLPYSCAVLSSGVG